MKKALVVLLILAVAGGAFAADPTFGAWGRGTFVPVKVLSDGNESDNNRIFTGTEVGWGDVPNFTFYTAIGGEQIGFIMNIDFAAMGRDGPLYTWWKPLEQFQLDVGWSRWDVLRGPDMMESFSSGTYAGFAQLDMPDVIFNRFSTAEWFEQKPGAILRITPIPNLYIGASILTGPGRGARGFLGLDHDSDPDTPNIEGGKLPDEIDDYVDDTNILMAVLRRSQYAAGYEIENIGLIRAGYFGTANADFYSGNAGATAQLIQAAFKLTAVENLFLDLGFGYYMHENFGDLYLNNMQLGLLANYAITDMVGLTFAFSGFFGGDKEEVGGQGMNLNFGITPEFKLDFATIGIGAYLSMTDTFDKEGGDRMAIPMGFSAYVSKAVGGGEIKAGVTAKISENAVDYEKKDILFQVPIQITYSIW